MTSRRRAALLILAIAWAFLAGRATATPRPAATAIPSDAWHRIEASPESKGAEGSQPGVNVTGGASPSPTLAAVATDVPATEGPSPDVSVSATAAPSRKPTGLLTVTTTFYCNRDLIRFDWSACRIGYPDRLGVDDLFAAVSADLAYLDGTTFTAWYRGKHVTVRAVDRCDCGSRKLDLYLDAFLHLAPSSVGRLYGVSITR